MAPHGNLPPARKPLEDELARSHPYPSPAIFSKDKELRHGPVQRPVERGPRAYERKSSQTPIGSNQERKLSFFSPTNVQRAMGEPAVGRDFAVKRSDLGEFREVMHIELHQILDSRTLVDCRGVELHLRHRTRVHRSPRCRAVGRSL